MKSFFGCQMQLALGFLEALIFGACNMTAPLDSLDHQTVSKSAYGSYTLHVNFEEGKYPLLRYCKGVTKNNVRCLDCVFCSCSIVYRC